MTTRLRLFHLALILELFLLLLNYAQAFGLLPTTTTRTRNQRRSFGLLRLSTKNNVPAAKATAAVTTVLASATTAVSSSSSSPSLLIQRQTSSSSSVILPPQARTAPPGLWRSLLPVANTAGVDLRLEWAFSTTSRTEDDDANDVDNKIAMEAAIRNIYNNNNNNRQKQLLTSAQAQELASLMCDFAKWVQSSQQQQLQQLSHNEDDETASSCCSSATSTATASCQHHAQKQKHRQQHRAKLRIVSSRGARAGTKCPQWHVDHVPFRWIQSLVGPGCDVVVDDCSVNWSRINALNDDENLSVAQRNRLLVPSAVAVEASSSSSLSPAVLQIPEGQAVVLLGGRWKEWASYHGGCCGVGHDNDDEEEVFRPAVHKSPTLLPWQGRVLLTMELVGGG